MQASKANNESFVCYLPQVHMGFDLILHECGYEKCDPLHSFGPERRYYYVVHYILAGKGQVSINGKRYTLEKNQGFFVSPKDVVWQEADAETPWEYRWVGFGGALIHSILDSMTVSSESPVFTFDDDNECARLLENIYLAAADKEELHLAAVGSLYLFLSYMVSCFKREDVTPSGSSDKYIYKILEVIHAHFREDLKIQNLEKSVGLERTQIYRLFKKHIGISPKKYVDGLRITYACALLVQNNLTLSRIAYECGYQDYAWFVETFKRIIGRHPKDFLRDYTKDDDFLMYNRRVRPVLENTRKYGQYFDGMPIFDGRRSH